MHVSLSSITSTLSSPIKTMTLKKVDIASLPVTTLSFNRNNMTSQSNDESALEFQSSSTLEHYFDDSAQPSLITESEVTSHQQAAQSTFHSAASGLHGFETSSWQGKYPAGFTTMRDMMTSTTSEMTPVDGSSRYYLPRVEIGTADALQSSQTSIGTVSPVTVNARIESFSPTGLSSSVTDVSSDVAGVGSDVLVSRITQLPVRTTEEYVALANEDTAHSDTQRLSTIVSSIFPHISESNQSSFPIPQDNASFSNFSFNNVTMTPNVPCDFPSMANNATDIHPSHPGLYDVIMEQFDVNEDSSMAVLVAKAVTLSILALVGVAGNALVIWSVVRQRHLHRPPFYYLLSLSLTDLSRAAFCLPLVLMTLLQGSVWRHGDSACDLFAFANSFFVLSSSVSLLDIAADRHLSLLYPYTYKRRSAGALNLVVVLLGWTLAFLVSFPPVVGLGAYAFEASEGQCTLRHKFFRHDNDTLGFLLVFTVLLLVTLIVYYRIFLSLRAHRKMRPLEHEPARSANWTFVGQGVNGPAFTNWVNGFGGTNLGPFPHLARNPFRPHYTRVVSLHVARNQHVIRLFFLMTLTFTVLWLPYQVLSYWRVFGSGTEIHAGLVTAAAWLSYGQVAVCPVVYFTSRAPTRRRPSRGDVSPDDKQHELLLESLHRQK